MRHKSSQTGLSLMEIAFVIVIFALLITGVFEGLRIIKNSKVKAFIIQVTQVKTAAETFRQRYGTWPGDFADATRRLRSCNGAGTAPFCENGNGDHIIASSNSNGCRLPAYNTPEQNFPCTNITGGNETAQFWRHLVLADLMPGIKLIRSTNYIWGDGLPRVRMGGGLQVVYGNDPNNKYIADYGSGNLTGHFISYQRLPGLLHSSFEATGDGPIAPWDTRSIDIQLDDGAPLTGIVRSTGAWGCGNVLLGNPAEDRVYTNTEQMQCFILYNFAS